MKIIERMRISRKDWISNQLKKFEEQNRITKRDYVSGEDHYLNGKRYILRVYDSNIPSIKIEKNNPFNKERIELIFKNFVNSDDYKKFQQVIKNLENM